MITSCVIVIFQEKSWRADETQREDAGAEEAIQRKTPFLQAAGTALKANRCKAQPEG
jgi:hypothetical protein